MRFESFLMYFVGGKKAFWKHGVIFDSPNVGVGGVSTKGSSNMSPKKRNIPAVSVWVCL